MNNIDRIIKVIDQISLWSGKAISWLIIPMTVCWSGRCSSAMPTVPRSGPWTWPPCLRDPFLHRGAMTLYLGKHIRTDFFYGNWSLKTQCWVDAICYLLPLPPRDGHVHLAELGFLRRILGPEGRADDDLEAARIPVQTGHPGERHSDPSPGDLGDSSNRYKLILTGVDDRYHRRPRPKSHESLHPRSAAGPAPGILER